VRYTGSVTTVISKGGTVGSPTIITQPILITEAGAYAAGGICELKVIYYVPNMANELHVEENVEISAQVPFPDNQGLLYLPRSSGLIMWLQRHYLI